MATKFFKKIGIVALAVFLLSSVGVYIQHDLAQAYVRYGPAAQLNAGDIKSSHILDGTIVGTDISSGASTTMNKFLTGELYATSSVSLPSGSITSTMILDGTINDSDIVSILNKMLGTTTIGSLTATSSVSLPVDSIESAEITNDTIVNADINSAAAIVDTKLAQITTASKVSGTALTSLASIPASAGIIPQANMLSGTTLSFKAIAGATLNTADSVYIQATSSIATTTTWHASGADCLEFGDATGGDEQIGQSIAETLIVNNLSLVVRKTGSPTADIILGIQASVADLPSGIYLTSTNIPNASITTSFATTTAVLSNPYTITNDTTYWLVASTTAPGSAIDNFLVQCSSGNPYSGGKAARKNPTWSQVGTGQYDWSLSLNEILTAGNAYQASAAKWESSNAWLGFAQATTTINNLVNIDVAGIAPGFNGLTAGLKYYLSNTLGTIASTPGTLDTQAGIAASSTSLVITR